MDGAYASDMAALKEVYGTLHKRKRDICNEINTLKYKGKMFPPIAAAARQPSPSQLQRVGGGSFDGEYSTATTVHEDTEESWTVDEDQSYNIEFNVEPKIVSASSKQSSSRLTKQSLRYDSFDEVSYDGENDRWRTSYYHDDRGNIEDVFDETAGGATRNGRGSSSSSSNGAESNGGCNLLLPGIEPNDGHGMRNGTTAVQEENYDDNGTGKGS